MDIVAGLSLKNLQPRVWDSESPFYLPDLSAVMVSYVDFHRMPARRRHAMDVGMHQALGIPPRIKVYLDNGSFSFLKSDQRVPADQYNEFVREARPDWWPVPRDVIPNPGMTDDEQSTCRIETMAENLTYSYDGFVPVIHISRVLEQYVVDLMASPELASKPRIGIGGIVPNLLRSPKAQSYGDILRNLERIRSVFHDKEIHLFGVGGTATLHIAALLGMDSVDSSGWRNRAARGLIQLPGTGDRLIAPLGSWRGREPSDAELNQLSKCQCPACSAYGIDGLRKTRVDGFANRAVHNLWVLLREQALIDQYRAEGTYDSWVFDHLDNSIYRPLIKRLVEDRQT